MRAKTGHPLNRQGGGNSLALHFVILLTNMQQSVGRSYLAAGWRVITPRITAGFPQQAPRLPRPEGTGGNYRRTGIKRENSDVTPPCLALSLSVRCPPVPTKASLSEQAVANIHPRMGGGMKLRQGYSPSCVPRPAAGGIAGGRAQPEKNRASGRAARREGGQHDVGLGRAPRLPRPEGAE